MTATDELRRLLDERGATIDESIYPDRRFALRVVGSDAEILLDNSYGRTGKYAVFNLTPEQAVEATLGSDLKAENAKLRKERDFYFQQVTDNGERAHGAIDALNAENAKLRKLCGELYHELYAAIDEYWPASYLGELEPRDVFPRYDELIELGVDA